MASPATKRARDSGSETPKSCRSFTSLTAMLDQRFAEQTKNLEGMLRTSNDELIRSMSKQFESLRQEFGLLSERVNHLEATVRVIEIADSDLNTVKDELTAVKAELQNLKDAANKNENLSIASELRIHGVPADEQENLTNLFNKICTAANAPPPIIKSIKRLKNSNNSTVVDGPIHVKLSSPRAKKSLLRSIAVLRRDKKTELALNHIGFESNTRIYINEQLTKHNYSILKAAVKMKKQNKFHAVFTRNGICQVNTDNAISVNSMQQLLALSRSLNNQSRNAATVDIANDVATDGFRDSATTSN